MADGMITPLYNFIHRPTRGKNLPDLGKNQGHQSSKVPCEWIRPRCLVLPERANFCERLTHAERLEYDVPFSKISPMLTGWWSTYSCKMLLPRQTR